MSQTRIIAPCKVGPCRRKIDSLGRSRRQGTDGKHATVTGLLAEEGMVPSRRSSEKENNLYLKDIIIWREVREVSLRLGHLCWESEKAGSPGSRLFWVRHIECDGESGCRPWRRRTSSSHSDWAGKFSPMWEITEKTGEYWVWEHIKGNQSEVQEMEAGLSPSW